MNYIFNVNDIDKKKKKKRKWNIIVCFFFNLGPILCIYYEIYNVYVIVSLLYLFFNCLLHTIRVLNPSL